MCDVRVPDGLDYVQLGDEFRFFGKLKLVSCKLCLYDHRFAERFCIVESV